MEDRLYIRLENVSKAYLLGNVSGTQQLKTALNQYNSGKDTDTVYALKDISLEINEGERVGIIGYNGAGKTTLLSIIGGFAKQTTGTVLVNGNINAIMTLGVGLREELTGKENIYINGELHGKTKAEIDLKLPEIIGFADIGGYIDKPMRTYSSGMKARLEFSMLSFIEPEILIIDEVLGVGDADFVHKSTNKIQELCEKGKILIVVSHSMKTIADMTDRAIWLHEGSVKMDSDSKSVTLAYTREVNRKREESELKARFEHRVDAESSNNKADIVELKLLSEDMNEKTIFEVHDKVFISAVIEVKEQIVNWNIRLSLYKIDGTLIMQNFISEEMQPLPILRKNEKLRIDTDLGNCSFGEGVYEVKYELIDSSNDEILGKELTVIKLENTSEFALSKPDYYCKYSIVKE